MKKLQSFETITDRFATFCRNDIDAGCARMAAINHCLNNLCGKVAWMELLKNKFYSA